MKLAILGGGGFRVPLVFGALLADPSAHCIDEIVLYDVDGDRLATIAAVLEGQAQEAQAVPAGRSGPRVWTTGDLDRALDGADLIFCAMRVGGLSGRVSDERVALDLGVLGQETTGAGGIAFGLRTVPVVRHIATRISTLAPNAWVVNFTNPAGLVTEAMLDSLGERVVGICDSPLGLVRRSAAALGHAPHQVHPDYVGLNHLGWLRALSVGGDDVLPQLLARADLLAEFEEGQLFGPEWIQDLGAIPNEYMYYYNFTRDAMADVGRAAQTRGEFLATQQQAFYQSLGRDPSQALARWRSARHERDASYLAELRHEQPRASEDLSAGGYEEVALRLVRALTFGEPAELILNVRNGPTLAGLPPDAVIEVTCRVDRRGWQPLPVAPLGGAKFGLIQQVKEVEQLTIRAALERSTRLATLAFAQHPLVDSVTTARALVSAYRAAHPEIGALLR